MKEARRAIAGSNAERTRLHNRRVVLGRIRAAGTLGRAEIARASGLTVQTVSNVIAELERDGLLREAGRRANGRGLPAVQYAIVPLGAVAFGVEIRPDALFVGLVDLEGNPLYSKRCALTRRSPHEVAGQTANALREAVGVTAIDPSRLLGAGVVLPGPFGRTGLGHAESELPEWQEIDAKELLSSTLGTPVIVENDANAAALAERVIGVAQGLDTYAYLYFGTGLGLGIVENGTLVRGAHGNAGEIGHIVVPYEGGAVELETVVSRFAMIHALDAAGLRLSNGADIENAFVARHPALLDWLDRAAQPLAIAVQTVENLCDPQCVILGGALPDPLLDALIDRMELPAASVSAMPGRKLPRVLRGSSGRMTAAYGGAALMLNRIFTPHLTEAE